MSRPDGYTPKTYAQSTVITELRGLIHLYERYPDKIDGPPAFYRAVMKQLAKMHNDLLDKSGLNGLHVELKE